MSVWRNTFYKTASGQAPVKDFINRQDKFEKNRIWRALGKLEELDGHLDAPLNEKVDEKKEIWELKMYRNLRSDEHISRIVYLRLLSDKKHVLFHAFRSKGSSIPKGEFEAAEQRINDYRAETS